MVALCAAQFMLILDVVIINVAIPSMRRDLGLLDSRVTLVGTAYTVAFGGLLIVSGRLGDQIGRRRILLAGLGTFVAASLLAGAAQLDWQLFAARGLQGVGAAMVSANALASITASLAEGPARNWALGLWAGVGSAGAIAGQLIGGAVTDLLGWRWIFLINVPVGLAVLAVLTIVVTETRPLAQRPRLDLAGALLLTGGLVSGLLALTWLAEESRTQWLWAAVISAALLIGFGQVERRHATPILRLALLRLPGVRTANVTLLLNAGALSATMFFITLYLQLALGYSALVVGLAFAPITLIILLLSPRVAALTGRFGVRRMLGTGLTLLAAGALLLARMPVAGNYWLDVLPGMLLLAFGSSLAYAPSFIAASSGVADDDQGAASGLINSAQEIGSAIGLATLALVAAWSSGGGDPTTLVGGYRTGLIGAGLLFAAAAGWAALAPGSLGRSPQAAHSHREAA